MFILRIAGPYHCGPLTANVGPHRHRYSVMPFFHVLIEGSNLCIPGQEDQPPIAGFFTSRVVWAAGANAAEAKALQSVRDVWVSGNCANQPTSDQLVLAVSESNAASFRQWLLAPNKGHVFFPMEPVAEAQPITAADGYAAR